MYKQILLIVMLLFSLSGFAKSQSKLKVLVAPSAPMVMENGVEGKYTGFEIELWEKIAKELNINYEYEQVYFQQIFPLMKKGNADVALGGINITSERENIVDFSYPYMESGRSILVKSSEAMSYWSVIQSIVSDKNVLKTTIGLVLFVFLAGLGFWITERGRDAISDDFFPGIFEGMWLTFTTMTTVGYGDFAPAKWTGRVFAILLMMVGISYFGYVAAVFVNIDFEQAGAIKSIDHLKGKTVVTLKGTESSKYIKTHSGILINEVKTEDQAHLQLATGHADAVVTDHISNLYFLKQDKYGEYGVYSEEFNKQGYGIALKQNSNLKEKIDKAILKMKESGEYQELYNRWFK